MSPAVLNQSKLKDNIQKIADKLRGKTSDLLDKKTKEEYQTLSRELAPLIRSGSNGFINELVGLGKLTDRYENDSFQEAALEAIPFEKIYGTVEKNLQEQEAKLNEAKTEEERNAITKYSYEDFLVKEVLRWFKEDFFKWVNKDACPYCGNANQDKLRLLRNEAASYIERVEGAASNTEIYQCLECNKSHRFPRYNNPKTLLQMRKGRCGEFANCFYLILRSLSIPTRYVWNREDHVWTEYYSANFGRWIHLDSCENAYNEPLLYCNNWGKKMSYVIGISVTGFVDLSNKYIDQRGNKGKQLPRNTIDEALLKKVIRFIDLGKKALISDKWELYDCYVQDVNEQRLLKDPEQIYNTTLTDNHQHKGRITGSEEWKQARGEAGGAGN